MPSAVARRRQGYEHEVEIREHRLIVDEPESRGGGDAGPSPTEILAGSLAACTAITIEMYADRKDWELGQIEVAVEYRSSNKGSAKFGVKIKIPAELSGDQLERILVIAGRCPVHRALKAQDVAISDELELIGG
jgi:putative redox protein